MFKINHQNILKGRIGPKNGLDEGALKKFCVGAQKHVSAVLKSADKEGYAFLKRSQISNRPRAFYFIMPTAV